MYHRGQRERITTSENTNVHHATVHHVSASHATATASLANATIVHATIVTAAATVLVPREIRTTIIIITTTQIPLPFRLLIFHSRQ